MIDSVCWLCVGFMVDFDEIKSEFRRRGVEEVLSGFDWKEFEGTIAEIFLENGFLTRNNFRFKTGRRYEIDIVAVKGNKVVCVDCKQWRGGRNKKSGIKSSAVAQIERTGEFHNFLKGNLIAQRKFGIKNLGKTKFYPLVVSLMDEVVVEKEGCYIIPAQKFNAFLVEFDTYLN